MTNLFGPHQNLIRGYQTPLDDELQEIVQAAAGNGAEELHGMIAYQLGWEGPGDLTRAQGKRIRPMLVLLGAQAAGGDWRAALPAAAAVELLHNFSLVHDDIEDQSPTRRGRPALWKRWGIAQAINSGDALFSLSSLALSRLEEELPGETILRAVRRFHQTCLRLTQGQHLDIAFEDRRDITLKQYWRMVGGKTAALLALSVELGAICAGSDTEIQEYYRNFGHYLGLAFQAQDDILGIWGEADQLGKSTSSDLTSGKKTLPVLFALGQDQDFQSHWSGTGIQADEVPQIALHLEQIGARAYAQSVSDRLTGMALEQLEKAHPQGDAGQALRTLTAKLLNRQS